MNIGKDLRCAATPYLHNRRKGIIAGLSACASLSVVALYQTGILRRLPGPRCGVFDAEKVNGSEQAYSILQTPDAVLGLGSYAATIGLIAMGPADRGESAPLIPIAMGVKALLDAGYAGKLSVDQWTKYRAFSLWSILAAAATMAALIFVTPEALAAAKRVTSPAHPDSKETA